MIARVLHVLLISILAIAIAVFSGCAKPTDETVPIQQVVPAPSIPSNTAFGPLYPRLNDLLLRENPDAAEAVRVVRDWAAAHLDGFNAAACAKTSVLGDAEFAATFGRATLGVTLPWMEIMIRDGRRQTGKFLWNDASLLASTVIHEFVHAQQRALQARRFLGTGPQCENARDALVSQESLWMNGFDSLKRLRHLPASYPPEAAALVYRWLSPIERARDEVHAAVVTIRWMEQHPDELNILTLGGVNNWAYAAQYLNHLRTLSTSNCFSPDPSAFEEEKAIYMREIPAYLETLERVGPGVRAFLNHHGLALTSLNLSEMAVEPRPTGRAGQACTSVIAELPQFPIDTERGRRWISLQPVPFDDPAR